MIHHHEFRDWTVEISDDAGFLGDQYETYWRSTTRFDKPCELFTIISNRNPDDTFVQVLLFKDGATQAWSWHPTMIQVSPPDKRIVIGLLKPENCVFDKSVREA